MLGTVTAATPVDGCWVLRLGCGHEEHRNRTGNSAAPLQVICWTCIAEAAKAITAARVAAQRAEAER